MAKVTYLDPNEDAPRIMWHGIKFLAGQAVEVDDKRYADMIATAKEHPHFKVAEGKAKAELAPVAAPAPAAVKAAPKIEKKKPASVPLPPFRKSKRRF